MDHLTVQDEMALTDYDRACQSKNYIDKISLKKDFALILGGEPLDTSFWQSGTGQLFIARFFYAEPDVDEKHVFDQIENVVIFDESEFVEISFKSSPLIIFDSAEQGREPNKTTISIEIKPGTYHVLTKEFSPDEQTSLLLHRFDRVAEVEI